MIPASARTGKHDKEEMRVSAISMMDGSHCFLIFVAANAVYPASHCTGKKTLIRPRGRYGGSSPLHVTHVVDLVLQTEAI